MGTVTSICLFIIQYIVPIAAFVLSLISIFKTGSYSKADRLIAISDLIFKSKEKFLISYRNYILDGKSIESINILGEDLMAYVKTIDLACCFYNSDKVCKKKFDSLFRDDISRNLNPEKLKKYIPEINFNIEDYKEVNKYLK